jgi:hypothetical protein
MPDFLGTTRRAPECKCLECGKLIDAATGLNQSHRPKPGDYAVCLGCGHVAAYTDGLTLRQLTADERDYVASDQKIARLRAALARLRGGR